MCSVIGVLFCISLITSDVENLHVVIGYLYFCEVAVQMPMFTVLSFIVELFVSLCILSTGPLSDIGLVNMLINMCWSVF